MTERQSLVAIEERLEIEDVPVAVEVRQEHLAPTEVAASLRATTADDRREQIGLTQRAETLAEGRRCRPDRRAGETPPNRDRPVLTARKAVPGRLSQL